MRSHWLTGFTVMVLGGILAMADDARVPDPITRRAVPADGGLTITDYGYRDWGPELVQYIVDAQRFPPASTQLVDAAGQVVPCQIDDGVLSFVASVPKGGAATWKLQPGAPAATSSLTVVEADGALVIGNEFIAI